MITSIRLMILLLVAGLSHLAQAQKSEEKLVHKAFDGYKSAILNDRGRDAVEYVDSRTINYYSGILEKVRHADSTEVEAMSILDKLMVFTIRHRTPREDILRYDGREVLIYAIESGMVGKSSVATNTIGKVTINENFATGQFIANGEPTPFDFHFYKEEGQWKVDLTSLFAISTAVFQDMADNSGQEENEFLFGLLEMLTGIAPGPGIWKTIH